MAQRAKVLLDGSKSNGLISTGSAQHEFTLKGCWKSEVAPKVGMIVEFELASDGTVRSIIPVPESQVAKEQADLVMQAAKAKGLALFAHASASLGTPVLVAWATVIVTWFFMNTINISVGGISGAGITFWDLLGVVNNSGGLASVGGGAGGKGIYALLAIVALAGPAVSQFWSDNKAHLANCIPLLLMLIVVVIFYIQLRSSVAEMGKMASGLGGSAVADMVNNMMAEAMKSVHIGIGAIAAFIASGYLAFVGVKRFIEGKVATA